VLDEDDVDAAARLLMDLEIFRWSCSAVGGQGANVIKLKPCSSFARCLRNRNELLRADDGDDVGSDSLHEEQVDRWFVFVDEADELSGLVRSSEVPASTAPSGLSSCRGWPFHGASSSTSTRSA
jgi:hypothetical protein